MSPLLIKISKDFATLWTTIDPIGNVALFAGLTAALTRSERHLTALRAVILCHYHPRGRRDRRPGDPRRDRHSHALAQSGWRHHSVPVRCADAFRENGCKDGKIARGGARPGGVPAGRAFHRRTWRNDGSDRLN